MSRNLLTLVFIVCCAGATSAQDLSNIQIHGFVTQGLLYSTNNNFLSTQSTSGSLQWTDGAVSVNDSLSDKLRVGIQFHMYQLGEFGGSRVDVDWASGDYKLNEQLGFRAGKVKTRFGLFNDSQDVDAVHLWALLPETFYPPDNKSFNLAHFGGDVYGRIPIAEKAGKLTYVGYAGYHYVETNSGYVQTFTDALGLTFTSAPYGYAYGGDLRWQTPLKGLMVGSSLLVSSLNGKATNGAFNSSKAVSPLFYAQFEKGKFYVAGEYKRLPVGVSVTLGPVTFPTSIDFRDWYVMTSYRVIQKLQVGAYYTQELDKAADTGLPANFFKDWVVSGRYDFNSYFYAKLEGHFINGNALGYYFSTNPNGLKPKSNTLAAKVGFTF